MPVSEVLIPATDEGLLRGDGVFEVIRLYGGRPFALSRSLKRRFGGGRVPCGGELSSMGIGRGRPERRLRCVIVRDLL